MKWEGRVRPQGLWVKQYEPRYAMLPARFKQGTALNACEKRSVDLVQDASAANSALCTLIALRGTLWLCQRCQLPNSQSKIWMRLLDMMSSHTHTHTHTHTHNINTAYRDFIQAEGFEVQTPVRARDFFFLRHIRQDRPPTAYPDYCTIRNGAFFSPPGGTAPGV